MKILSIVALKNYRTFKGVERIMSNLGLTNKDRQKLKDEIKTIMVYQAKMKKPIYYGELCGKINSFNLSPDDQLLHDILGEISKESFKMGKGMLSVFAVKKETGLPGKGFFSSAMDLGYRITKWERFAKEQRDLVHNQYRDRTILTFDD